MQRRSSDECGVFICNRIRTPPHYVGDRVGPTLLGHAGSCRVVLPLHSQHKTTILLASSTCRFMTRRYACPVNICPSPQDLTDDTNGGRLTQQWLCVELLRGETQQDDPHTPLNPVVREDRGDRKRWCSCSDLPGVQFVVSCISYTHRASICP